MLSTTSAMRFRSDDMRRDLRQHLDERWRRLGGGRSPEDVANFGAHNPDERLCAYGLLRLAAVEHRDKAAAAAADKLLAGLQPASTEGSPYRGTAFVPAQSEQQRNTADPRERAAADSFQCRSDKRESAIKIRNFG